MALANSDILFGKLAIGRKYVTRESAIAIANEIDGSGQRGRPESFSQAAVRLGYLKPSRTNELLELLRAGFLVCRGSCGESYQLGLMSPEETVACGQCGGPLYVKRSESGDTSAATETKGSTTFLNLDRPLGPSETPPAELPSAIIHAKKEGDVKQDGGNAASTFLDLDDDFDEAVAEATPTTDPTAATAVDIDVPAPDFETTGWSLADAGFEPFSIGDLLVLAPVGKGAMGTVYRARRESTQEVLAVKILSSQAGLNEEVVARFKREVLLSSRLSHPNIVRVYDAGLVPNGDYEGRPYYTMAYVQGRDLEGWAKDRQPTLDEAIAMIVKICDGMNYAHGHGVIHRDLKPGNVLVDTEDGDRPLICDFGLAKYRADLQNLTQTGDILGTPSYMPPEQALGQRQKIGPPTDTYAIGAILYYLLTSRPPFTAPSAFATINKVVRHPPTPPAEHNPAVSAGLEKIVLKALSKEPVDRFHTCSDLAEALERLS